MPPMRSTAGAVALIWLWVPLVSVSSPGRIARLLGKAEAQCAAGEFLKGLELLETADDLAHGRHHEVLLSLAYCSIPIGKHRESARFADRALKVATSDPARARAAIAGARAVYEEALFPPLDERAAAGHAQIRPKLLIHAEFLLLRALEFQPGIAEPYFWLGLVYEAGNSLEYARESYERCRQAGGRFAELASLRLVGGMAAEQGDTDVTAPVELDSALDSMPKRFRKQGVRGTLITQALLSSQGGLEELIVIKGIHPEVDSHYLEQLARWRDTPAASTTRSAGLPITHILTIRTGGAPPAIPR